MQARECASFEQVVMKPLTEDVFAEVSNMPQELMLDMLGLCT